MIFSIRSCWTIGIFCFILLFSTYQSKAQKYEWDVPLTTIGDSLKSSTGEVTLTGIIVDQKTGNPISGATISVDGLKYFDHADEQGRYAIQLPAGKHKVVIRHIGMLPVYMRLAIYSTGVLNPRMQEGVVGLDEVVITARAIDGNVKDALSGVSKLSITEIKALPTLMGEVDVVRSIQLLPGVSTVGEGASGFNVRGGRTDQNLILLNGAPLFNSSHALGLVSAFNSDFVQNFTLYKGNVPAQLGGRTSSVLEVQTRKGDFEKWKYQVGAGPMTAKIAIEGPLQKNKTSLLIGGRTTYSNWILRKATNPDIKNSSLFFYDANVVLAHRFNSASDAELSYYSSQDNFQFSQQFAYKWSNYLVTAKWNSFTDRKISSQLLSSYGYYKSQLIDPAGVDASTLQNELGYAQLKESLFYNYSESLNFSGGVEGVIYLPGMERLSPYQNNSAINPKKAGKNKGMEAAAFLQSEITITEKLALSTGIRFSMFAQLGADTTFVYQQNQPRKRESIIDTLFFSLGKIIKSYSGLEPRLSIRYTVDNTKSVKASYNRMRQYIQLISNTTAPTPVDLWQVSSSYIPPQYSDNYSLGYFWNLKENMFETSIEGFYKSINNMIEYKDFPSLYLNPHIETELLAGKGKAYGAEFFIRKLKGRWSGWISYTYSRSLIKVESRFKDELVNDGKWYSSNFDRPSNLNIVATRRMGRKGSFSILFNYTQGRPMTAVETSYLINDTVVPVYSNRNQYRIPDYFRLDLSLSIGDVVKKWDDSLSISFYNFFGRQNAYSVFYQRPSSNYFIPKAYKLSVLGAALPSITYNITF